MEQNEEECSETNAFLAEATSILTDVPPEWLSLMPDHVCLSCVLSSLGFTPPLKPASIAPKTECIFLAFQRTLPSSVRVVILGQDCYPTHGFATGLAFGVPDGIPAPPSLRNIQKEVLSDTGETLIDTTLETWAEQGVLLLNSALTVLCGAAGSHLSSWEPYTDEIIRRFGASSKNVVFLLWGAYARKKKYLISTERGHLILEAAHPSPLSANRGGFFGCRHFSRTNEYIASRRGQSDVVVWGSQRNEHHQVNLIK